MKIEEAKVALEIELLTIYRIQQSIRWIFENHIVEPLESKELESDLRNAENGLVLARMNDLLNYVETVRCLMNGLQEEIDALQISL